MTKVTMECIACGTHARRELNETIACRGVHETNGKPSTCPKCRQPMTKRKEKHKSKHAGKKGKHGGSR
jgi:hypothetical protein